MSNALHRPDPSAGAGAHHCRRPESVVPPHRAETDPRGHPADRGTRRDLRRGTAVARPSPWHVALPLYSPLPVLIWAALRFRHPAGASLALDLRCVRGNLGRRSGYRPFH